MIINKEITLSKLKNEKIKDLKIREYECLECKSYLDRDYNASENIMFEELKKHMKKVII